MVLPAGAQAIVAGHIEGKVTALSGGAAVPGIEVCADSTVEYECAETNSEGKYAIEVLEGSYTVSFENENCLGSTCFPADYLSQYYKDAANYSEAEKVKVTAGLKTTNINAALVRGASLEGEVTKAVGGEALQGIYVCAYSSEPEYAEKCGWTEEEGYYSLVGLPTGHYTISFTGGQQCPEACFELNYVKQYYSDKKSSGEATEVAVNAGEERNGLVAKMKEGARIEGVVTAAAGGAPQFDLEVCPRAVSGAEGECTSTAANGHYKLEGLEGEYAIAFYGNGSTLGPELYEEATKTSSEKLVKVTPGSTTTGINGSLSASGQISGVVTAAPSGSPVAGVDVCARSETGFSECVYTDAAGEYTIKGVVGTYSVEFYGDESCKGSCTNLPYKNQYYNGIYNSERAEELTVASGAAVTGINARLAESVKQGEEETEARKIAEAVAKQRAQEAIAEAARRHEAEVKAQEAAAAKAQEERRLAEEHARAQAAANASVKVGRIRDTSTSVLITLKVAGRDTVTVTGAGLKRLVAVIPAGTHVVTVHLTSSGRAARRRHKKIKLEISVKVGTFVVALHRTLKL